jgi:hypothetical protein
VNPTFEVPLIFDPDEMLQWLLEQSEYRDFTADVIETAIERLGRNAGPGVLISLVCESALTETAATALTAQVWSSAEFPEEQLGRPDWLHLFAMAGYTIDGDDRAVPAQRPAQPTALYRGAPASHRGRMAWTSSLERAWWFARRWPHLGPASVWTAQVEPWRLLAACNGRNEGEFVINPEDLAITQVDS